MKELRNTGDGFAISNTTNGMTFSHCFANGVGCKINFFVYWPEG